MCSQNGAIMTVIITKIVEGCNILFNYLLKIDLNASC